MSPELKTKVHERQLIPRLTEENYPEWTSLVKRAATKRRVVVLEALTAVYFNVLSRFRGGEGRSVSSSELKKGSIPKLSLIQRRLAVNRRSG
mmetsp:Transcript_12848/g.18493  ORF Transcript_12848/g.18493 Transcript_12848/m.18493 type:complete len:92 (+) Transcript_12848:379-654(+)